MGFYSDIECRVPNRSVFNLQHSNTTSLQFNKIYPLMNLETLPNDSFKIHSSALARFAPMLAPSFGSLKMYEHRFFVPRRIIDPYWTNFWSERKDGSRCFSLKCPYSNNTINSDRPHGENAGVLDSYIDRLVAGVPVWSKDSSLLAEQSLADYLGLPPLEIGECTNETFDLAPFLAYQFIYNEYYRDSQIEEDLFNTPKRHLWWLTSEGFETFLRQFENGGIWYEKLLRNHTSISGVRSTGLIRLEDLQDGVLPFTEFDLWQTIQSQSVTGLTDESLNLFTEIIHDLFHLRTRAWYKDYFTCARTNIVNDEVPIVPVKFNEVFSSSINQPHEVGDLWGNGNSADANVVVNASGSPVTRATRFQKLGFTISALRLANAIQKKEEKIVLFGKRYIEQLASRFGVIASDASLQRPLYIGGSQQNVYMNEITQTSESTTASAQGNYAGQAMVSGDSDSDEFFTEEHGVILSLFSVMCETSYSQGLSRQWTRNTSPLNFYDPQFAALTDQEVKQQELMVNGNSVMKYYDELRNSWTFAPVNRNTDIFGYQGRWDEYRTIPNRYCGQMRDELRYWHFGRKFATIKDYAKNAVPQPFLEGVTSVNSPILKNNDKWYWLFTCGEPTGLGVEVPIYWFSAGVLDSLSSSKLSALKAGTYFLAYEFPSTTIQQILNNTDSEKVQALLQGLVLPPKLLPSFIHSNVPTSPFALTTEFENIRTPFSYFAGDDYIFMDLNNNVSAVRAMPEQSIPKI